MGLFKPDPPTPPNPVVTAAAQTGTNVSTAIANTMLNRTNQVTPQGSLTYNTTGSHIGPIPPPGKLQHSAADSDADTVAARPGHPGAKRSRATERRRHGQCVVRQHCAASVEAAGFERRPGRR